jgi:hypothetical protein
VHQVNGLPRALELIRTKVSIREYGNAEHRQPARMSNDEGGRAKCAGSNEHQQQEWQRVQKRTRNSHGIKERRIDQSG